MIRAIANSLLAIAFPQHCHVCGAPVEDAACGVACLSCWDSTHIFTPASSLCRKCGNPLSAARGSDGTASCHECIDHLYDAAASGGVYEQALASVVLELKKTTHLPARAAEALVSAFVRIGGQNADVLVPVPLSSKRRAERGFNQAEFIAGYLSKQTGILVDALSLRRSKHTPMHRAAMDRKAREQTVKNAFEITRPKLTEGRSVLLVDDIFTTGATASYCAKELKKHGAASVMVITLARAIRSTT